MKIQKKTVGREKSKNGKNLRNFTYLLVKFSLRIQGGSKDFCKIVEARGFALIFFFFLIHDRIYIIT